MAENHTSLAKQLKDAVLVQDEAFHDLRAEIESKLSSLHLPKKWKKIRTELVDDAALSFAAIDTEFVYTKKTASRSLLFSLAVMNVKGEVLLDCKVDPWLNLVQMFNVFSKGLKLFSAARLREKIKQH